MNIVYFGGGSRGLECIKTLLLNNDIKIVCICSKDKDEFSKLAKEKNVPFLKISDFKDQSIIDRLKSLDADIFVLSGFNKILNKEVLSIPTITTLNLHGGKLPRYRGAAPINWQIINGEKKGSAVILEVDEGIDTGPILIQENYSIMPMDDHYSILRKTNNIFTTLLNKVLSNLDYYLSNKKNQNTNTEGHFIRRSPQDSKILWSKYSDVQVHNLIRGMHGPYQWAYTFLNKKKIEIQKSTLLDYTYNGPAGKVGQKINNGRVVICSNRGLLINNIRSNKNIIPSINILNYGDYLDE